MSPHACPNCLEIASKVRNWQAFVSRRDGCSYQIGSWQAFQRAKDCETCQSLVRLFESKIYFGAFVSIFPSYDRKDLIIRLSELDADPEELSVSRVSFLSMFFRPDGDNLGPEGLTDARDLYRLGVMN